MKPARRAAYHHGNLRPILLAQAARILDRDGVDAVTIRAVARAARVAHSAPANHFADRRALLTALAAAFFRQIGKRIETELAARERSPHARVRSFASVLLDFGLSYPHRYRLLWRRDILDVANAELNGAMDAVHASLLGELSAARWTGTGSVETFSIALWSMVHGYVSMRIDGTFVARHDEVTGTARQDAILDLLFEGVEHSLEQRPKTPRRQSRAR